jgi:hypothetical protein
MIWYLASDTGASGYRREECRGIYCTVASTNYEVSMGEIQDLNQAQRDAEMWAEWVSGVSQEEIGRRRGIQQPAVSKGISRFVASTPLEDRFLFLLRALERLEQLHRTFSPMAEKEKDKGAARIVIQAQALAGRYLGLDSPAKLELYQAQDQIRHETIDVRAELAALVAKVQKEQRDAVA